MELAKLDHPRLNGFSYVGNNPLSMIDPTGFIGEGVVRQSGFPDLSLPNELVTPSDVFLVGQEVRRQLVHEINGARAPTNDTDTTGDAGNGIAPQVTDPDAPTSSFFNGVWDGGRDLRRELPGIVSDMGHPDMALVSTAIDVVDAYQQGDAIDAINVVNPAMPFARFGFAIDEGDWYTVGRTSVGIGVTIVAALVARKAGGGGSPKKTSVHDHHLLTNKNYVSTAQGGPWSPIFEDMAGKAGMTLEDAANRVRIDGHSGPHPRAYHQEVFRRLTKATRGLGGEAYSSAFRFELQAIRVEAATAGSALNQLVVK